MHQFHFKGQEVILEHGGSQDYCVDFMLAGVFQGVDYLGFILELLLIQVNDLVVLNCIDFDVFNYFLRDQFFEQVFKFHMSMVNFQRIVHNGKLLLLYPFLRLIWDPIQRFWEFLVQQHQSITEHHLGILLDNIRNIFLVQQIPYRNQNNKKQSNCSNFYNASELFCIGTLIAVRENYFENLFQFYLRIWMCYFFFIWQ